MAKKRQTKAKTKAQPIIFCKSYGCHWRGRRPSGTQPRCPHCTKLLFPRNYLYD